jgi:ribosomal protein S18 acetylase RimI-like enzyme
VSAAKPHSPATIRRAGPGDEAALAGIGLSTFIDTFAHLYSPENLAAFLGDNHSVQYYQELLSDPDCAAWIAETADGETVGYCTVAPCTLPAPDMPDRSGELCRIYLDARAQGLGLGKALMDIALSWLEERFDHLYVGVYSENFRAQELYRRYGFEKVGEYHFMVGDHADLEWIMRRSAKNIEKNPIL